MLLLGKVQLSSGSCCSSLVYCNIRGKMMRGDVVRVSGVYCKQAIIMEYRNVLVAVLGRVRAMVWSEILESAAVLLQVVPLQVVHIVQRKARGREM